MLGDVANDHELTDEVRTVFTHYYETNHWGGSESRSGMGSSKDRGIFLAKRLPVLLETLNVRSMLDIPCGDMNWMADFPLGNISYIGADVVSDLIRRNERLYPHLGTFVCLDACRDRLPHAELIFCRDMIIHLPNRLIASFLRNVSQSSARWLICTRFLGPIGPNGVNGDIGIGDFRAVDLCEAPFNLPPPIAMIPEFFHKWKTLGLWNIDDIREKAGDWLNDDPADCP